MMSNSSNETNNLKSGTYFWGRIIRAEKSSIVELRHPHAHACDIGLRASVYAGALSFLSFILFTVLNQNVLVGVSALLTVLFSVMFVGFMIFTESHAETIARAYIYEDDNTRKTVDFVSSLQPFLSKNCNAELPEGFTRYGYVKERILGYVQQQRKEALLFQNAYIEGELEAHETRNQKEQEWVQEAILRKNIRTLAGSDSRLADDLEKSLIKDRSDRFK